MADSLSSFGTCMKYCFIMKVPVMVTMPGRDEGQVAAHDPHEVEEGEFRDERHLRGYHHRRQVEEKDDISVPLKGIFAKE